VAEEVLNGADVGAALEETRREGMAHRVATGWLGNVGLADGVPELPLHGCFVDVVPGDPSGAGMGTEGGRRKQVPVCGGFDGEFGKALEETLACRGDALTGWIWLRWGRHGSHIPCS